MAPQGATATTATVPPVASTPDAPPHFINHDPAMLMDALRTVVADDMDVPSLAQQLPPVADGATRLFLCRHGQTEYNRLHKYQGRGVDTPLNPAGILQASCLARAMRHVPLRAIYSSSLRRARETATIVAQFHPKLELETYRDLEEMSFGVMEGQDHEAFEDDVHAIHQQWRAGGYNTRFPAGECPLDVVKRGCAKIDALVRNTFSRDHVLIVTHGRFNKVVLAQLLHGNLEHMHELLQDNTCVNVVDYDHATQTYKAVALNNTLHLSAALAVAS